eukprot:jgi/Botrbrau1/15597/Bobra.0246s0011.1
MQPMLRQHYMNFRQVLSQRLSPAHLPNDAVGMCLLVRYVLQVTFGLVLPVTLGYWRELKDRQQFALLYNVHLKKNTWKGFLMHCLEAYGTCLIVMGFLAQIIVGIPEVADLPHGYHRWSTQRVWRLSGWHNRPEAVLVASSPTLCVTLDMGEVAIPVLPNQVKYNIIKSNQITSNKIMTWKVCPQVLTATMALCKSELGRLF